ncbi:hypothetical protein D9M71_811700 [compost metagenome]
MPLIIAEHHAVSTSLMFETVMQPFFGAQPLKKLQIRLPKLRAEIPGRIIPAQLETP